MTERPTYWDVPEKERHSLAETQIEFYCRRELADAGYVYPNPPTKLPEEAPTISDTTTYYQPQIDRFNKLDVAFETMEDAVSFLKMNAVEVERDWRSDVFYSKPLVGITIEPIELPSEGQIDAIKQALGEAKENKDANRKAREEFDKDVRVCDDLIENVRKDFRDRGAHERLLQGIRDTFAEFLEIANKNTQVATTFLLKQNDRELSIEALGDKLVLTAQTVDEACADVAEAE